MSMPVFQFNSHLQKQAADCIWPMGHKLLPYVFPSPNLSLIEELSDFIKLRILLGLVIDMGIPMWKNSPLKHASERCVCCHLFSSFEEKSFKVATNRETG